MRKTFQASKLLCLNSLMLATLVAPAGAPAAEPPAKKDPAAILAVVSGNVNVIREKTTLDGSFGAALEPGDVVETGEGAQAAVLFESGQIIELGPGSRITIGSVPGKPGESPVLAQVSDAFSGSLGKFARSSAGGEGLALLPTDLRSGGGEDTPEPLSPRNTRVAPGEGTFSWTPVEEVLEYRVILAAPGGKETVYPSAEPTWSAPASLFQAGDRWTWSVEAVTPDGAVRSAEAAFEVATVEDWTEIAALKSRLEPLFGSDDPTRRDAATYLYGSYCRSSGFYGEAITQLEQLVVRHPTRKELHEELGSLYQAVGRNDKAAEEYRLALKD